MPCLGNKINCLCLKSAAGFTAGLVLFSLGIVIFVNTILSGRVLTPIGWMALVQGMWMSMLGMVIFLLQLSEWEGFLCKWAMFLAPRAGRGIFYLFCGSIGGAAFTNSGEWWLVVLGYINLVCCWTMALG